MKRKLELLDCLFHHSLMERLRPEVRERWLADAMRRLHFLFLLVVIMKLP
jgi:hypothetical protein